MTEARLYKRGHLYLLRCQAGEEQVLLDALIERLRQNPAKHAWDFDWVDLAICSHQLGQRDFLFEKARAEIKQALTKPFPNWKEGQDGNGL